MTSATQEDKARTRLGYPQTEGSYLAIIKILAGKWPDRIDGGKGGPPRAVDTAGGEFTDIFGNDTMVLMVVSVE